MLKALRRHPLMVGTGELLVDTVRYVALVSVLLIILAQAIKLAF